LKFQWTRAYGIRTSWKLEVVGTLLIHWTDSTHSSHVH